MADFTLECPKCGQQTTFSGLDEAPRGVLCGQCGGDAVLGEPGAREPGQRAGETNPQLAVTETYGGPEPDEEE